MDESTSNLDFVTENIIFDMIYNRFKNNSMLIVAHRLATVKNCDIIIVLNNGEIVEQGTHDELLEKKGGTIDYGKCSRVILLLRKSKVSWRPRM